MKGLLRLAVFAVKSSQMPWRLRVSRRFAADTSDKTRYCYHSESEELQYSLRCNFHASRILKSMIGILHRIKLYEIVVRELFPRVKRNDLILRSMQDQNVLGKVNVV